jgi:DNA-binding MarR family transcriptional regulator
MSDEAIDGIHRELNVLARRVRSEAHRLHPELSFVAYTLLRHAHATGGCRAVDLAALYQLDKSTISRQVGDLERRGLLERAHGDRGQLLRVTAAGRAELDAAASGQRAALTRRLEGWDAADLGAFAGYLERYNASDGTVSP